jgi:tRNA U34 5-carboxymethylaminomethyl modifying enzyme MnmG/GidA
LICLEFPESHADRDRCTGLYEDYDALQAAEIAVFNSEEEYLIPADIDFNSVGGLSDEVKAILTRDRPRSLVSRSLSKDEKTRRDC